MIHARWAPVSAIYYLEILNPSFRAGRGFQARFSFVVQRQGCRGATPALSGLRRKRQRSEVYDY